MEALPRRHVQDVRLGDDALARIAAALADLYFALYEERPLDPHASLTGNMLGFVFGDGLSVADEWLLLHGNDERLREFREHFLSVISDELTAVVADLTGLPVTYSFYGFDPKTRTTHSIFVLDLSALNTSEQRQAVLNWSEQVRRNARRLREEHIATRETHRALTDQMRAQRDQMLREAAGDDQTTPPSDDR
jgi:Co/Zn/Cd efflux system component